MERILIVAIAISSSACVFPAPQAPQEPTECSPRLARTLTGLASVAGATTILAYTAYNTASQMSPPYNGCGGLFQPDCGSGPKAEPMAKWPLITTTAVLAAASIAAWSAHAACERHAAHEEVAAPPPIDEHRAAVEAMSREAMADLDANNCDGVRAIATRVRSLDADYYVGVFAPTFTTCITTTVSDR